MKKYLIYFSITCFCLLPPTAYAQNTMIPSKTLLQNQKEGWERLQELIKSATNKLEILPANNATAEKELHLCQVTAGSVLGAVIYNTGGILVEKGLIRILGSGSAKLSRAAGTWNTGKTIQPDHAKPAYFLIADDVLGGIFALNGGALGDDIGNVYYFPPDDLHWMPLSMPYSRFLEFCFIGDLATFYKGTQWTGWQAMVAKTNADETIVFSPPLWSKEGADIDKVSKTRIKMEDRFKEIASFLTPTGTK